MLITSTNKDLTEVGQTYRVFLTRNYLRDVTDIVTLFCLGRHKRDVWKVNNILLDLNRKSSLSFRVVTERPQVKPIFTDLLPSRRI